MGEPVRISVVIPAFNSSQFIDDALASVARQARPASEVIVVDDGSQDDTAKCAQAWADRLSPTRFVLLRGPNVGLSVARNRGVLASTSDVVAFLDADDVFEPDHLATLAPAFELHAGVSLAFGDMTRWGGVDDGNRLLAPVREALYQNSRASGIDGLLLLNAGVRAIYLRKHRIAPSSWLVARRAFAAAGLFDPTLRYAEDIDFLCRLFDTGGSAWCDRPTGKKRDHGANMTSAAAAPITEPQLMYVLARIRRFSLGLTPAERASVDAAIDVAAREVQYVSAGSGLAAYFRSRGRARDLTGRPAPFVLRQLLRSMLPSWLLKRRNQRYQMHA